MRVFLLIAIALVFEIANITRRSYLIILISNFQIICITIISCPVNITLIIVWIYI